MPTTTNFGWTTPADTDLVSQGAAAMRTIANGVDTSMAKLKGGTTGQVLTKTSATDMDFTWASNGWEQLATGTLSGTTVSLTGISGSYTDLRLVLANAGMSGAGQISLRFGTASIDTGSNYQANTQALGTAAWTAGATTTSLLASGTNATFSLCVYDIYEYSRTTSGKHVLGFAGVSGGTSRTTVLGCWNGGAIAYLNVIGSTSFTGGTYILYGRK